MHFPALLWPYVPPPCYGHCCHDGEQTENLLVTNQFFLQIEIVLQELITGEHLVTKLGNAKWDIYIKNIRVLQDMDKDEKYHRVFLRQL